MTSPWVGPKFAASVCVTAANSALPSANFIICQSLF